MKKAKSLRSLPYEKNKKNDQEGPITPDDSSPAVIEELVALQGQTYSGIVILRLDEAFDLPDKNELREIATQNLEDLEAILRELRAQKIRRLFPAPLLQQVRQLEAEVYGANKKGARPSLTSYWRIDLRGETVDPQDLVNRLCKVRGVKEAYREFSARPASLPDCTSDSYLTGGYRFSQRYLCPAPIGVDVREAWARSKGAGVRVIDVELGWALPHEDLPQNKLRLVGGDVSPVQQNLFHGTAVLGILGAAHNDQGICGIAPEVDWIGCSSTYSQADLTITNIAAAICRAIIASQPGDVILVEVERNHFLGHGVPVQIDRTDWLAIALAVAHGRVVIEPAGNAILDLKNFDLGPDSGAILVGGCGNCEDPLRRTYASNYGGALHCFAWGTKVETCGFGDAQGLSGANFYTAKFGGSSAASAIVAGVAVLVQSLAGKPLKPAQMREYLSKLGTPQQTMGVMPDLRQIIGKL